MAVDQAVRGSGLAETNTLSDIGRISSRNWNRDSATHHELRRLPVVEIGLRSLAVIGKGFGELDIGPFFVVKALGLVFVGVHVTFDRGAVRAILEGK